MLAEGYMYIQVVGRGAPGAGEEGQGSRNSVTGEQEKKKEPLMRF